MPLAIHGGLPLPYRNHFFLFPSFRLFFPEREDGVSPPSRTQSFPDFVFGLIGIFSLPRIFSPPHPRLLGWYLDRCLGFFWVLFFSLFFRLTQRVRSAVFGETGERPFWPSRQSDQSPFRWRGTTPSPPKNMTPLFFPTNDFFGTPQWEMPPLFSVPMSTLPLPSF